jgi:hypothetical protein
MLLRSPIPCQRAWTLVRSREREPTGLCSRWDGSAEPAEMQTPALRYGMTIRLGRSLVQRIVRRRSMPTRARSGSHSGRHTPARTMPAQTPRSQTARVAYSTDTRWQRPADTERRKEARRTDERAEAQSSSCLSSSQRRPPESSRNEERRPEGRLSKTLKKRASLTQR